jgi:ATP-dependent Clp protease ATP-binding subunit ClpA
MVPTSPLSLQDAIHWVDSESQDQETLVRLRAASALVEELADIGDAVLDFFVDRARHDGHSWSEIGVALGVSKQAAQQKHTARVSLGPNGPTFEQLTPRARSVVRGAERIARSWGHGYLGTEHLLVALYREPACVGAKVLVSSGLSQKRAESAVAERVGRGKGPLEGDLPYTPRALAVFTTALSSALARGHNYIGTEHLLLGLAQGEGIAAVVLRDGGLTPETVAREIEVKLARSVEARGPLEAIRKKTATTANASASASASKKATSARKARRR